jgi:aryl-alcohol dehydrogenase-like predicted oxidoreductase
MKRRHFLLGSGGSLLAGSMTPAFGHGGKAHRHGEQMLVRKIPASGETLPVIGLGTSGPFEVGADEAARAPLREVLQACLAVGAKLIDTSPMYSTAEQVLGELLTAEQQRSSFIATKVWTPNSGADAERKGIEQMQRSMQLMKRERVELMQVHNLVDLETHLKTLRRWQEQGKIKYIGITHYTVAAQADLEAVIRREKLDFVQFNYSAATRDAERTLLPLCADKGVAVLINRAFEDGKLFAAVKGKPLPPWAAEFDATSWAQIFLKYVIAHPAVTCVIPATGKLRNALDNLGGGRGRLPDDKLRARIAASLS